MFILPPAPSEGGGAETGSIITFILTQLLLYSYCKSKTLTTEKNFIQYVSLPFGEGWGGD
jgi:hypothetical protein